MSVDAPGGKSLVAGPLSLFLDDGGLRYIRLGHREVVRRIYVAVRDHTWATIPWTVSDLELDEKPDSFAARFLVDHRRDDLHFRWRGDLRGEHDGSITFRMEGEALSTFDRNRIGICVLHPIDECAGQSCLVGHGDGKDAEGTFPRLIAPEQPFFDIGRLSHDVGDATVELEFEGDVFEMEDQRNWSDASYKTYSTPIGLPKPVTVTPGTTVVQQVKLRVKAPRTATRARAAHDLTLTLGGRAMVALPQLGLTFASYATRSDRDLQRLAGLRPSYLRVELFPDSPDHLQVLEEAALLAKAVGAHLGIALAVTSEPEIALNALAALAARLPRLAFLDLVPATGPVTPAGAVAAARKILGEALVGVPLGAGSKTHFTEVNRNRGAFDGADVVFFPNSPQVHMTDDLTIVENLAALPWIAETARSFLGNRLLALSPVSLKPRPKPGARPGPDGLPPDADPRQASLLAACFTVGHLAAAAEAGFTRVTYYQTTGPLGVMVPSGGPALPASFLGQPGSVFPLYHVLADIAEFTGAEVLEARSSEPLAVRALVLRAAGRLRAMVANLSTSRRNVQLPPALTRGRVRRVDTAVLPDAMGEPETFRTTAPREVAGDLLSLSPHEVVRIDVAD